MPPIRWSAATTTVVCSGLGPMASFTFFSAIRAGVVSCRIFPTDRLVPAKRTISLAAQNRIMAHLSGVILRLNDDGSPPADNPFFAAGATVGGEVGANIQKIFSYGHRNSFGMAFDPFSVTLWLQGDS